MGSRGRWWALFALGVCVASAWGLASPRQNGPDEPDHTKRALSTVRGQLLGDFVLGPRGPRMVVTVPASVCGGILQDAADCVYHPSSSEADTQTNEWRHPPPYYVVVGLPSLVWTGGYGGYAMRFVSLAIGTAMLAFAFSSAVDSGRGLLVAGVYLAATPITWFLVAEVNPNGVEIAAAICAWTSVLVAATQPAVSERVVRRAGLGLVVFVMSRGISPLYALIALGAALALATPDRRRELGRRRDVRGWLAASAAGCCVTGVWVVVAGFSHNVHRDGHAWSVALRESAMFMQESVGDWLDLRVSLPYAVAAYAAIVIPLVWLAVLRGSRVERRVLVTVLVIALVLPVTSNTLNIPPIASAWQGRYGLPLVVGVVLVAANASRLRITQTWWRGLIAVVAIAHIAAFVVFVRHWVESTSKAVALVTAHAIAVALLALVLDRAASTPATPGGTESPRVALAPVRHPS